MKKRSILGLILVLTTLGASRAAFSDEEPALQASASNLDLHHEIRIDGGGILVPALEDEVDGVTLGLVGLTFTFLPSAHFGFELGVANVFNPGNLVLDLHAMPKGYVGSGADQLALGAGVDVWIVHGTVTLLAAEIGWEHHFDNHFAFALNARMMSPITQFGFPLPEIRAGVGYRF
jgi:hypothetical protein